MGNIGHKFFLAVLSAGNFTCHIIQTGCQITDFIITFHLKIIMHVTACILLCRMCDFAQRYVNHICKENQNDKREQK